MKVRDFVRNPMTPRQEQMYGIEVEYENYRSMGILPTGWGWLTTDDGSLRNAGVEFLTPGAWTFDQSVEQIRNLWTAAEQHGWQSSIRTGIHVHVNCLDYTLEQLGGILATYALLEPVLFRLCGPEREEGIYCVPWYRADDEAEAAQEVITGAYLRANNTCKYSALYLQPLLRFGTIEFRHAPTFLQASDMLLWLSVIDALVRYGKGCTAKGVVDRFDSVGADQWFEGVFPRHLVTAIRDRCEKSIEDIVDEVDAMACAETLLPFNEAEVDGWTAPALYVQGTGTDGYHAIASHINRINRHRPMFAVDDFDEPEHYYDEETDEYYEEDL